MNPVRNLPDKSRVWIRLFHALTLMLACVGIAQAQPGPKQLKHVPPEYLSCFEEAATNFRVPKKVLIAIARVESGFNPYAYHHNTNGSLDVGVMQINSRHIPFLEKHGVKANMLWDACTNIKVGAWVLAQQIHAHGSTWRAVGAYNAHDEWKRREYARKVWVAINQEKESTTITSVHGK